MICPSSQFHIINYSDHAAMDFEAEWSNIDHFETEEQKRISSGRHVLLTSYEKKTLTVRVLYQTKCYVNVIQLDITISLMESR
jgi:hypothetical protein